MTLDRYVKAVLTVIAIALVVIALNPWLTSVRALLDAKTEPHLRTAMILSSNLLATLEVRQILLGLTPIETNRTLVKENPGTMSPRRQITLPLTLKARCSTLSTM